jgi:hypothetical protein
MTIKINAKNMSGLVKNIDESLKKKVLQSFDDRDKYSLGDFIERLIRVRTRLGYGVDQNEGQKTKLKPLKDSTVKTRVNSKKRGDLSNETSPKRSNLTASGELLESIVYKLTKLGIKLYIPKTKHKGTDATNEEIASYMQNGTNTAPKRPFFNVSAAEIKQIKRFVQNIIKSKLSGKRIKLD